MTSLATLFAEGQRVPELDDGDFGELLEIVAEESKRRGDDWAARALWLDRHGVTALAALALAALQYADPTSIYEAIRELHPDRDFAGWISDVEETRARMREAQGGPR